MPNESKFSGDPNDDEGVRHYRIYISALLKQAREAYEQGDPIKGALLFAEAAGFIAVLRLLIISLTH